MGTVAVQEDETNLSYSRNFKPIHRDVSESA